MLIRQNGRSLVVHTPAKLNLFLDVLAKRDDGFHELVTLMTKVSLFDTLSFREDSSGTIQLQCCNAGSANRIGNDNDANLSNTVVPTGQDNLVVRAAHLLRDFSGIQSGARIQLLKRIPAAAGLAGGSSDAAAALVTLNQLWQTGLSSQELHTLAAQLGSDVNFFLADASFAICRGRGQFVEPHKLPTRLHFVIAWPDTGLSTANVFRHLQIAPSGKTVDQLAVHMQHGNLSGFAKSLHNSLQHPAEQLSKEVRHLKSVFMDLPVLGHMMSGSGSAYFGICRSQRHSQHVAARLKALHVGRVFAVCSQS